MADKVTSENIKQEQDATTDSELEARIAELAYYKAEARGFLPGHEMDDWLEAERELTVMED
ncbi:MAG: DUF2934 domain-containing protein [Gammaproteobacteria bacterium]